ncbi:MAG: YicC/YloC family endoribonuclease [Acutalibacteraceae bacterium]|nr:YicC/YloC family endoribonuclease [Acutalibacteraceae bacterium]
MVRSMTGFGRAKKEIDSLDITVEIKSVNHRYFEFSARLPRSYNFLEEKLKSFLAQNISRGKVEISVMIEDNSQNATVVEIDRDYANAYITALKQLSKEFKIKNDIGASSFVGNNDLFKIRRKVADDQTVQNAVLTVAKEALDNFIEMRSIEGERLLNDVKSRTAYILKKVEFIEERSPETVKLYKERIEQKIKELLNDTAPDEQRILTEVAIFADKVAVAEETVRLRSHIKQFEDLLSDTNPVGRKLDFIVQEMNRETNTIGSKAQDIEIAHTVVDIKSEIEKIREQIQNME